jgi:hypothetical protein
MNPIAQMTAADRTQGQHDLAFLLIGRYRPRFDLPSAISEAGRRGVHNIGGLVAVAALGNWRDGDGAQWPEPMHEVDQRAPLPWLRLCRRHSGIRTQSPLASGPSGDLEASRRHGRTRPVIARSLGGGALHGARPPTRRRLYSRSHPHLTRPHERAPRRTGERRGHLDSPSLRVPRAEEAGARSARRRPCA